MSNFKDSDYIRFHLSAIESPTFTSLQMQAAASELSPVTNLAMNLGDTTIASTPRRRLSLSSVDETPPMCKIKMIQPDSMDFSSADSSASENRLLKNAIKLPSSNPNQSFSRARNFSRRINLTPLPSGYDKCRSPRNKENHGSVIPQSDESPSKYPVLKQTSSPLRQRQPLEDQDPNSQDSGYGTGFPDKEEIKTGFRFTEPLGIAPRRHLVDQSPRKDNVCTSPRKILIGENSTSPRNKLIGGNFCTSPRNKLTGENFCISPRSQLIGDNLCISPRSKLFGENVSTSPRTKIIGHNRPALFHSLSNSGGSESGDDGFLDLFECEKLQDEDTQLPSGLGSLLSCPLKEQNITIEQPSVFAEPRPRLSLVRSHSVGEVVPLTCSRTTVRSCLFKTPSPVQAHEPAVLLSNISPHLESIRSFKRPDPPCENVNPIHTKRPKYNPLHTIQEGTPNPTTQEQRNLLKFTSERPVVRLQRSFSETEATIKRALQRSTQDPDLIGDFSKPFVLPLMEGRHQDLKTISPDTLAALMRGEFNDTVDSFTIIDCRYPYEYDGGHIRGAKNIYTKDQIFKELVDMNKFCSKTSTSTSSTGSKRSILIFHCEFSSERGPSLSRFLRNSDRDQNKEYYPALNYPEVYLLHGGYKGFFEMFGDMCEPCFYLPMLDPSHESDLRLFRSKSKSWNGDSKSRLALRNNLKRLGL